MTVAPPGRLRILFFLLHGGYLRHYDAPLRLLATRGHEIHLSFNRYEKDAGDAELVRRIVADHPEITASLAPERSRRDKWRGLAWLGRGLADLARYMHPRYDEAPALRERMARKVQTHVLTAKGLDPVSSWICHRIVDTMTTRSSERAARRGTAIFSALDRAIPASAEIKRYITAKDPDVVLVSPLIDLASNQAEFLKAAKRLGLRTGVGIASWDNLTGKGLMRTVPDRVLVWNEIQRGEAEDLHGIPRDRVVLTGAQKFDDWFERRPSTTPHAFRSKVGLPADTPFLLYLCSSPFIAPQEVDFVRRWSTALRASEVEGLAHISVLVRPHPQNAEQWLAVELEGVSIWPREGQQPDRDDARSAFFDSLAHSTAVVGINTSALIEAGIVGKSVYTVLAPEFKQESTLHFHYLKFENGGFLHTASSLDEHVRQLERVLVAGADDSEQTRRFIASFVRPNGIDRPASPIVADEIEAIGRDPQPAPDRPPAWALALRVPLLAVASLTWVAAAGRAVRWRLRFRYSDDPEIVAMRAKVRTHAEEQRTYVEL